ncbi:MAG TPA: SRPBCC family protein [Acidimicrobiales bacterium]|nr:SRPBCC family protein [Acidimicrobiales bacterium]
MTEHGSLEKINDVRAKLTFVRELRHAPEEVWAAITEPEGLRAWFPSAIEGERVAGAALKFVFPFPDAPVMEGVMRVYDPPQVLEFDWAQDRLRFELEPIDGGTRLTLVNTFTDYDKSARDAGGWHACLDNLGYALDGVEPPYDRNDRWRQVTPWYYANFPPEATTALIPDFHPDAAEANQLRGGG